MGYDETLRDFRSFLTLPEELDAVKWLGLDHVDVEVKRPWESYDKAVLIRSFSHLAEIFLIMHSDDSREGHWPASTDLIDDVAWSAKPRREMTTTGEFFVPCRDRPEELFRIWADFRRNFMSEQRMLEDVERDLGKEVRRVELPTVRIVEKSTVAAV